MVLRSARGRVEGECGSGADGSFFGWRGLLCPRRTGWFGRECVWVTGKTACFLFVFLLFCFSFVLFSLQLLFVTSVPLSH